MKEELVNLNENQLNALREFYVERFVDNMETKDLVQYVTDDMFQYMESLPDNEVIEECLNYWDDSFEDVVEEIIEFEQCEFKKTLEDKKDDYLDRLIREGEIDAIFSPREPNSLLDSDTPVIRMYDNVGAAERDYCRRTGFFPIMHCLAVKKTLLSNYPDLPEHLFQLFVRAKEFSLHELSLGNVLRVSLPWVHELQKELTKLMGGNPWPYGLSANHEEITALIRYAVMDGIAVKSVQAEDLFHPQTHSLLDL